MTCDEIIQTVEKFYFHFDDPLLEEKGFLQVNDRDQDHRSVTVHFPARSPDQTNYFSASTLNRTIQLFINQKLVYSLHLLPILSWKDYTTCQELLIHSYYSLLCSPDIDSYQNPWTTTTYYPTSNNELSTIFIHDKITLSCYENSHTTVLELECQEVSPEQQTPDLFILEIGNQSVFNSGKHLALVQPKLQKFMTTFLIQKLMK